MKSKIRFKDLTGSWTGQRFTTLALLKPLNRLLKTLRDYWIVSHWSKKPSTSWNDQTKPGMTILPTHKP